MGLAVHRDRAWKSDGLHQWCTRNKEPGKRVDFGFIVISASFSPLLPAEHFYMFDPFILALPFFVP